VLKGVTKSKKLVLTAMMVTLIIIGTYIKIPLPLAPKTLQIMFTTFAGLMLGGLWGGVAVATYIFMGLIGLPVFTAGGGVAYVLHPTFGYLIGFLIGTMACGAIVSRSKTKKLWIYFVACGVNLIISYACGMVYYYLIITFYTGGSVSIETIFISLFLILIGPDIFLCGLSAVVSWKLHPILMNTCRRVVDEEDFAHIALVSNAEYSQNNCDQNENNLNDSSLNDHVIDELKGKVLAGEMLSRDELLSLQFVGLHKLCESANEIREVFCGSKFHLCTIINARSGSCSEDCRYCAQSSHHNVDIDEYGLLSTDKLLLGASRASEQGVSNFSLVTSGRGLSHIDIDSIASSVSYIRKECDINICGSHGLLSKSDLAKLKSAGVVRYHNNLETSRANFPNICTTHTYDDKIATIKNAIEVGLSVCVGGIIGLGESFEDRVDMALDIAELGVQSVPLNLFTPIDGTPLARVSRVSYEEFLRTIAIFRFAMPSVFIRLAGGRGLMSDKGERAFLSGANATITGDLLTTSGIDTASDIDMLARLGYENLQN